MEKVTRLFDFPQYQLEKFNLKTTFATKYQDKWETVSSQQYVDRANQLSRGLIRLGIQPNDKIAIIAHNNSADWHIADIGILQTGAQNVPIYPTISAEDYAYILNHSEAKYCIVSDSEILEKLNSIRKEVPELKEVYGLRDLKGVPSLSEVFKLGEDTSIQQEVESRKNAVSADDLATLIYTSGTTGKPKAVMLSHNNIVSNVLGSEERVPLVSGDKALSFLPICHIFERMVVYLYQYCGISIHFAESIDKMSENLKEVKPHVMTVVPRLIEKVFDKIHAKGSELSGIKKKLFFWAVSIGESFEPYGAKGPWYEFKLSIARKLIFSKWQEGLGGNLKILVSGSAALQPRLARIFGAAGIPVMEGYGLTETSPVIAVNDQNNHGWKIGTVGRMLPNVEVKIAEDGEILCKGPNIMLGYYKDKEKTKEAMNGDYFHTGDIGQIDDDGFLKITDRKKEMFKTSGGKYVAPQMIENQMKQSRFIEQIMVVGEGEKMPCAIIQPNFEFVKQWAQRRKLNITDNKELVKDPKVIARIEKEVAKYNQQFGRWEQVKKFELTPEEWSVEAGHLTPTLKLKRRVIKEKYMDLYNLMYKQE